MYDVLARIYFQGSRIRHRRKNLGEIIFQIQFAGIN